MISEILTEPMKPMNKEKSKKFSSFQKVMWHSGSEMEAEEENDPFFDQNNADNDGDDDEGEGDDLMQNLEG